MKSYIVGTAMFLILMFFPLQWALNEKNHYKRNTLINIVEVHAQQARMEGYFTPEIKESLINNIENKLNTNNIKMTLTETPKYRMETFNEYEMIEYHVEMRIDKIIAMPAFFGFDDDTNSYWFPVTGKVSSEKLIER